MRSATAGAAPVAALSVHQRVTGGPDGDVEFTLRLAGGTVAFEPGPARPGPADVELSADYGTAVAISQGRLSPASAFAAGRLQVAGAVSSLVAHQEALADIGKLLGGTTEATTY
jgi:putative sterol carrier protein